MAMRMIVVDDDISICRIITNLVQHYQLGQVLAECSDGISAEQEIRECQPDLVLVDLLLPGQDGIELVRKLSKEYPNISFIMISQVSNQPMITRAYESGIEFFIHKPINALEVVSVLNKVQETRKLRRMMHAICQATAQYAAVPVPADDGAQALLFKDRVYKCFSDLGILGEAGAKDIYLILELLNNMGGEVQNDTYQLNDYYQKLSQKTGQDSKTIEQRVRRTIVKTLKNMANLGLEDYYNDKFQLYSTALFDFQEIRQTMEFLKHKSNYSGKINVKKFLGGLLFLSQGN